MGGLLVVMGSGETAPTMVKPHRSIFERVGDRPAVLLDTPYGFQSNADDISARAVGYFAASVGRRVDVVSWRTAPPAGLARERATAALNAAGWIFAGPGSPTYALKHWRGSPVEAALVDVLTRDGVVVLASAAALTLGSHTVPVYEIYKAGVDPRWEPGLDVVRRVTGLPAVVIPHYDNAEGGNHDTRYCYLGEGRLSAMESELPDGAFVLGVDEHTAVLLDLEARVATVVGNGTLTIRRAGQGVSCPAGTSLTFDEIAASATRPAAGSGAGVAWTEESSDAGASDEGRRHLAGPRPRASEASASSLRGATDAIVARFDDALRRRDVDGCVEAVLELEQTLLDWAADTLTSDEGDHARGQLRGMVVRLGELATRGARDPRAVVGPLVETLLELRRRAREARDWATGDWVRDQLTAGGVEVRDTPDGAEWHLRDA